MELNKLNKEINSLELVKNNCKNLISYEDIIKEIIKIKYKLPIRNNSINSLTNLNSKITKYQTDLENLLSE